MHWFNSKRRTACRIATAQCVLIGSLSIAGGGCISGSLATSSGPRPPGFAWSPEERQAAHVAENVKFDFVLTDWLGKRLDPTGLADYCVAIFDRERIEIELHPNGYFRFEHPITAAPDTSIPVEVTAYRQLAGRDLIKVGDQWLVSSSPFELPDRKVASASVTLLVYQCEVRLRMPRPPDDLDPETGVMRIYRDDGSSTSVYIDRPGRLGFRITGPGPDGYYDITFNPSGEMLNDHGTTKVDFRIHDLAGQRHECSAPIETP